MRHIVTWVERFVIAIGRAGSLVLPLLMIVIIVNVTARYVFGIGSIELEELQWHLNAIVVMSCLAWTYQRDGHVRVDAFHARMTPRTRALVELCGVVFLLLPFLWFVTASAWTIFGYSWKLGEGSPMPSGLPARYIIKFVMAAGLSLLFLQGIAAALKSLMILSAPRHGQE